MTDKIKDFFKRHGFRVFLVTVIAIDVLLVWTIVHYKLIQNEDTMTINSDFEHVLVQPDEGINILEPEVEIEANFE